MARATLRFDFYSQILVVKILWYKYRFLLWSAEPFYLNLQLAEHLFLQVRFLSGFEFETSGGVSNQFQPSTETAYLT